MNFTLPTSITAAKPVEITKFGSQPSGGFEMLLASGLQGETASAETNEQTGFANLDGQDLIGAEVQEGFALFPVLFAGQTVLSSGQGILGENLNVEAASNEGQAIASIVALGSQAVAAPITVAPPLIVGTFDMVPISAGLPEQVSAGSILQTGSNAGVQAVMVQTAQALSTQVVAGVNATENDVMSTVPPSLIQNPVQTLTSEILSDTSSSDVWGPSAASGQLVPSPPSELFSRSGLQNSSGVPAVVAAQAVQTSEPKVKGLSVNGTNAEQTKLGISSVVPKIGSTETTVLETEAAIDKPVKVQSKTSETSSFLNALSQGGKATVEVLPLMPLAEKSEMPRELEAGGSLLPDQISQIKASGPLEVAIKPQAKPFAQALVAQVKAIDIKEGRTSVSLHPRGLGQIEIDIVTDKDSSLRVVVRVENPMVLQTLRDERQMLATAMGLTDAGTFEFEQGFSGDSNQDKHGQSTQAQGDDVGFAGPISDIRHEDVVDDDQLDILT